jgi:hypothetical protein
MLLRELQREQKSDLVISFFPLRHSSVSHTTRCYRNGYGLLKGAGYHATPLDMVRFSDIDTLDVPVGAANTNSLRRTISRML